MYEQILRRMQSAVRAGRVQFTRHALDELAMDDLSPQDAGNCILTGEIVKDQYDEFYKEMKYVIYGDALAGDEMAVVARWDNSRSVVVITVYRLRITDYE
jgi:hypothetical protein